MVAVLRYASRGEVPDEDLVLAEADGGDAARRQALYVRLRAWLEHERDRQAENRAEMARDADCYDGMQFTEDEAAAIRERGQIPLVYNETKVAIDWIIGTEKRNRVDWRVLPREKSDHESAVVKTKVMKYVSDVNRVPFARSAAFAEAVKSGLSWIEDSLSSDATADVLYCGHESWRNVLHDSYHRNSDGRDMRYVFRWRHVDLDVAEALFPAHVTELRRAAMEADQLTADDDEALWYLGDRIGVGADRSTLGRRSLGSVVSNVLSSRRRVKVYEAWYREPTQVEVVQGGPYHGQVHDPAHVGQQRALMQGGAEVLPRVVLRVRVAMMTDTAVLFDAETPFSHNELPFTPVYCFRRERDGLPYGHVRQMRDPQFDLNKRMSKTLFLLSVNQLVVDKGTFDAEGDGYTLQDAIDSVSNPNGVFVKNDPSSTFEIRRDYAEIRQQLEMVALDRQFLQTTGGVTDELLGRRTNAVSGTAITARQEQGSVTTAGVFDNYRLALSLSGQKQLSNAERFYSLPKVIRLTEPKGPENEGRGLAWVSINEPVIGADGQVEFLNDITQTAADFVVDEQDFRASARQALFDQLVELLRIIGATNPAVALGLVDHVIDLSDFPGKEAMVAKARELIAEARGQPTDPEAAQAVGERQALEQRAQAVRIAREEAQADKLDAEADTIRAALPLGAVATDLVRGGGAAPAAGVPAGVPAAEPAVPVGAGSPAGVPLGSPLSPPLSPPLGSVSAAPAVSGAGVGGPVPAAVPTAVPTAVPAVPGVGGVSDPAALEAQQAMAAALEAVSQALALSQQTAQATTAQLTALDAGQRRTQERLAQELAAVAVTLDGISQSPVREPQPAPAEPVGEPVEPALPAAVVAALEQLSALVLRETRPRAKRITMPGPDGQPITATIEPLEVTAGSEARAGSKRITMPGPDGESITATIEPLE